MMKRVLVFLIEVPAGNSLEIVEGRNKVD